MPLLEDGSFADDFGSMWNKVRRANRMVAEQTWDELRRAVGSQGRIKGKDYESGEEVELGVNRVQYWMLAAVLLVTSRR